MRSAPSRLRTTSSRSAAKWQHRTITSSAFAGYFSPIRRFEKLDVHKARLHFSNLASTKNLSTNALAEWCGAALFIMLGIRNEKLGMGRHWCVCRGGACPARPRSGKRTAKSIGCTAVSAVPPDVSLRGRFAPVAISGRQLRFRRNFSCNSAGCCEIAPQGHFLALRAQGATSACGLLAMTNLGASRR